MCYCRVESRYQQVSEADYTGTGIAVTRAADARTAESGLEIFISVDSDVADERSARIWTVEIT